MARHAPNHAAPPARTPARAFHRRKRRWLDATWTFRGPKVWWLGSTRTFHEPKRPWLGPARTFRGPKVWLAVIAALTVALGLLVPRAIAAQHREATWVQAQQPADAQGQAQPSDPTITGTGDVRSPTLASVNFSGEFLGWAMLDRATKTVTGERLTQTSSTESMIKTWLVADFLRRSAAEKGGTATTAELRLASEAIRWSDDGAAQTLYQANGADVSIQRMITMCGLTDTTVYPDWWSRTQTSPRDAVRLGECLINGTAAGPQWTDWVLAEMRQVQGSTAPGEQQATRGGGRWGIIDGVPAALATTVAIKNGWTSIKADGNWHLNCLAITDDWSISVMMRYPNNLGLDYGAGVCGSIARHLLA